MAAVSFGADPGRQRHSRPHLSAALGTSSSRLNKKLVFFRDYTRNES
jgi:hypothetical protein